MNSLFAKILLWFWATLAITVVGSALISALTMDENVSNREAPVSRLVALQLEEARAAWESGGAPALSAFLDRLSRIYGAEGILTDAAGRDLATGRDRSGLLRRTRLRLPLRLFRWGGSAMLARVSGDGRYRFFLLMPRPRIGSWFLMPEHLFMLAFAALMCYWLAWHFTAPVRALRHAVERFGRGDLSARANLARGDEIGELARSFDRMAGRIETLLDAERRLLLDISHELRSPLARLGVAVELARSGDDPGAALDRIQKESDRLNALVGQLLEVTRAEGDPAVLRRQPVRLDELAAELVADAGIEASARGSLLRLDAHEPVTVEGDAELLRRAIENVLRNAIRYSPRDTAVEVTLSTRGGAAVLRVRDCGPGVPEETLPYLFDAFYRVEAGRDRSSGGVGLGLSIARRAVELHRGRIRARNAQPGLEVEMELPLAAPRSAEAG
jgi:two-component system sensor histidine kinase CpxA